ncbi:MAG: hypothetical protein H6712_21590 [Myxococcales bacterium]|nr:hypothetical protein [Myxococcales bacterium]
MLNLDAAVQLHGLTLFRDFNDPQLYWYMPNSPRLAREGRDPLFQLLLYRDSATPPSSGDTDRGGGFLTMTVDLAVPEATLEAVKGELASTAGGPVRLAAVPFESGSVRVTALGVAGGSAAGFTAGGSGDEDAAPARPAFVENMLGFTKPSMYGDNRAAFSFELSQKGAILMEASLEDDGASAIAVLYDLEYMGLRPAREVKIVIEYQQSYHHLRNRVQANTLWFKADIDSEMERLTQSGAITIEDVTYIELEPDKAKERADELRNFAKELAQWTFFKPALRPGNVLAADRGSITVYDPTTAATANTAGFTTPLDLLPGGRGREGDGPVVNPGITERTGGVRGSETGTEAAANANATGNTANTGNTAGTGNTAANTGQPREPTAVERWNQAGRPQAAFLMRELDQRESQRIEFNMRQVSAHKRAAAPQGSIRLLAGDSDLRGRIKRVDLDDAFWKTIAGTITSNADFEKAGVSSMVVSLRYGVRPDGSGPKDTAELVLEKEGDEGKYEFFLDHLKSIELEYKVTVSFKAEYAIGSQKTKAESGWIRTTTRNLDIDPRELRAVMPVRVVAGQVDWDAVKSLQTTVTYRDPPNHIEAARTLTLSQSDSSALVPIRPENAEQQQFQVSSTFFYEGDTRETVEQTVSRGFDVVLNQPPSKAVPISISAQDPLQRLSRITVELSYAPESGPEQTKLLTLTGGEVKSWSLFRPSLDAPVRYRYRVTLFGTRGTTDQGEWMETTERQLIVGDIFPDTLEVEVQPIGDLASSNIQIARLKLHYPSAPEGVDATEERVLRGALEPIRWTVPSKVSPVTEYQWELMCVFNDRRVKVEKGTSDQEILFLFIPTEP